MRDSRPGDSAPERGRPETRPDARARPDRALGLLGMATRAGAVVPGTERVREAARAGTLRLAVMASDASDNSRGKLLPLLTARGISHVIRYERSALGAAIGRGPVSAVGVVDAALADRLMAILGERGVEGIG
ncbi:MAG TPA: ribosomal L7Ae/L30e/S12e/Gadd45 family protein [Longimicrobiales bacterium]|nr:ribosomal L7Ae/L30e/S12e/Gadd45 family protein [Longimicrobiales bacterium]